MAIPTIPDEIKSLTGEEVYAYLLLNSQKLPERDRAFADSLVEKAAKYHGFTENQDFWARVMVAKAEGLMGADKAPVQLGSLDGLLSLFKNAKGNLKWPTILAPTPEGRVLKLTIAGPTAKVPGSINVTTNAKFGQSTWFGRVLQNGQFEPAKNPDQAVIDDVTAALRKLAKDPVSVVQQYAKLHGACCFCSLPLTDPQSVKAGMGETCAKNYGLLKQYKEAV
jgi:hypothetical protein